MFGGEYQKPTGWLTNAPHLQKIAVACPGGPGHKHPPLEGLVKNFQGEWVWKTSLASEYPQGLCEVLAREFLDVVKQEGDRPDLEFLSHKDGFNNKREESAAFRREQENEECIGGLRNPVKSLERVPGWYRVGSRLFWTIENLQQVDTQFHDLYNIVGANVDFNFEDALDKLRNAMATEFSVGSPPKSGLWSELMVQMTKDANDPDTEAATWPQRGTPLGILEEIVPGGVFPRDEEHNPRELDRMLALDTLVGTEGNYQTYEQNKQDADDLFTQELQKGFVDWSTDKSTLEDKYGPLVQSSIGVIVKQKREGKKVRLVHDLRRSGVNEAIKCSERLVLPRLRDVVEDAMCLFESLEPGESLGLMSLKTHSSNSLFVIAKSDICLDQRLADFSFTMLFFFGIGTGPLVWARIAALVARITQSMFSASRSRLQIYVDDPLALMRGTTEQIHDMCNKILWLWLTLGLQISWKKGTLGSHVEWIGSHIEPRNYDKTIILTVTQEKLSEWKHLLIQLIKKPTVSRKLLVQFTGKMSWASGFLMQPKPFVRMLHAALALNTRVSNNGAVYFKQVEPALKCLQHFFNDIKGSLRWEVRAHVRHHCSLHIVVDASPWGGGAILYQNNQPVQLLTLVWNSNDEKHTGAKIGEAGSQAVWECYIVLRALWCWMKFGQQGVLSALLRRSAKSPLLNNVVREITLFLAKDFKSLETIHVWSEYNELADSLSRIKDPNKPAVIPEVLKSCHLLEDAPQFWHKPLE